MFARLSKLFKGFLSLFVSGIEAQNPKALLEGEIVAMQEAVALYNKNLAKQAGMVERMKMQLNKEKAAVDKLKARIQAMVNAKQMEEAGRMALEAKNRASALADMQQQFDQADQQYRNLTQQRDVYIRDAHRRIQSIKTKLSQAEIAESQAKLAEIANSASFDMAGSGATLERLEEKLDERVSEAKGKARVAADASGTGAWAVKAEEEKALEQQALSDFVSLMGMPQAAPVQAAPPHAAPQLPRELGGG